MRKIILLLSIIAIALGASWMADHAGQFSLNWLGWQIEGSVAFLLVALLLSASLIWLIMHWLNALFHIPSELRKERKRLMSGKGLDHITQAMIAASENDTKSSQKHLDKARHFLPDSPLPRLMQLQLAGRQKDSKLAHQQFTQLQHFAPTKALALRGLAEQARKQGDMDLALTYTDDLLKEAPNNVTSQKLAIDIFSYHRRWQEALKLVKQAYAQKHLNADEYKRANATIAMQQATTMLEEKNRQSAMEMLKKATSADPSLQPAAIQYAELLRQIGKPAQAAKILRNSWKHTPHPEVAKAHAELFKDMTPEKQAKKAKELAKQNSQALETQTLLAEAAMQAEEWDNAKNHLKIGMSKQETVTLCRLMAQLYKKGYSDETEERRWLDKAITATPDASWQCTHCGAQPEDWRAHCKECYDFANIYWRPEGFMAG